MQVIPLYFDLREEQVVGGRPDARFEITVRLRGRFTSVVEEDGETWAYGVNPGGIAQGGENLSAAYANFRQALVDAIHDFAGWAENLQQFRAEFRGFFLKVAQEIEEDWIAARQEVRNGHVPDLALRLETDDLEPLLEIRAQRSRRTAPARRSSPLPVADPRLQPRLAA